MLRHAAILIATACMATVMASKPAHAQDSWWYAGGSLNYGDYSTADKQDSGWAGFVGYEFTPNYALEVGYSDLGSIRQSAQGVGTLDFSVKLVEFVGISAFELTERISMYGKIGWYRDDTTFRLNLVDEAPLSSSDRDSNFTYAIGARINMRTNFAIRGDWQRYRKVSDFTNIDVYAVGVIAKFGGR